MKTAVVDVGGGMRGVYASGVLDRCLKEDVNLTFASVFLPEAPILHPLCPVRWGATCSSTTITHFGRNT